MKILNTLEVQPEQRKKTIPKDTMELTKLQNCYSSKRAEIQVRKVYEVILIF